MICVAEIEDAAEYGVARELFLEYAASLGLTPCFQGFAHELEHLPEMYGPPTGCLIVGRDATEAVACVGVRRLSAETCEMKRLYVRRGARGSGLGRRLALEAVSAGRRLGYGRMVLDTLDNMVVARQLYFALGFEETVAYYDNPPAGVRFMALDLRLPNGRATA
jgi:GNAT superfamily N-acetyltransferase